MATTKAAKAERAEAIAQLRELIKPGDTVYTILDHVSSSGMSRAIRVLVPMIDRHDDEHTPATVDFRHPNWAVGKALGLRHWKRNGREQDALVVGGCGMDMGFHLVYELSHALYGATLHADVYRKDARTLEKDGKGPLLTREGAPEGKVWVGGYQCLGKGKCPSNYHVNHRNVINCPGVGTGDDHQYCWAPGGFFGRRDEIPADWPRRMIDIGDGQMIEGPPLHCLSWDAGEIPAGTTDLIMAEDGSARKICPTCKGDGSLPNPDGPERFDLVHTDGYALRHRWL